MSGQLQRNSNHEATRKRGGNSILKGGNMNVAIRLTFCSAMLATFFTSTAIAVSDGETAFLSIYGERIKQVTKTADSDDDAELASTLLRDLIQVKDSALRHIMLASAYDLGARSDSGLETANRAVNLLAAEFPVPAADILTKRRQLAELVYAQAGPNRADAAKTLIGFYFITAQADVTNANYDTAHRWMTRAAQVATEADLPDVGKAVQFETSLMSDGQQVQEKIAAIKSDASKKSEWVKLLLTERDDVKAAEVAAKGLSDETLSRIIKVVGTDLKQVQPDDLLFAGDWYMRQSENASQAGKLICLGQAHQYYERFLVLRQTVDETRLRSESAMRMAEAELAKLNSQRLDNVLKGHEAIVIAPWTLYALADDACEIRINGKLVLTTVKCEGRFSRIASLNKGDKITAKLIDSQDGSQLNSRFWLRIDDANKRLRVISNNTSWRMYSPRDPVQWWSVDPTASDRSAVEHNQRVGEFLPEIKRIHPGIDSITDQMIWGSGKTAYLYFVVQN